MFYLLMVRVIEFRCFCSICVINERMRPREKIKISYLFLMIECLVRSLGLFVMSLPTNQEVLGSNPGSALG